MITRIAVPLAAAALGLAACGGSDDKRATPYPKAAQDNFLTACKTSSNGKEDACKCALSKLEETVPYADFARADAAIRAGDKATGETAKRISAAISGCA